MPSPAARLRCSLDELPSTTAAHAVSSMCAAPALLPGSEAADGHTVWCVQRKSGHILTHFGLLKLRSPTTCICVVAAAVTVGCCLRWKDSAGVGPAQSAHWGPSWLTGRKHHPSNVKVTDEVQTVVTGLPAAAVQRFVILYMKLSLLKRHEGPATWRQLQVA